MPGTSGKKKTSKADSPTATPRPASDEAPSTEFSVMFSKITELAEKLGGLKYIKEQSDDMLKNYAFLSVRYDDQQKQMQEILAENKAMRDEMSVIMNTLADVQKENRHLKQKIDDMEQYSRNANIEIAGVPETPGEIPETIMTTIAQKLNVKVEKTDIEAAHRVPSQQNPKPLVVRFKERRVRDAVYEKARKERLSAKDLCSTFAETPIFVNEHLTPERKRLIVEARIKRTALKYKYLWTRSGTIYMKKDDNSLPVKISSNEDLCKLT
jgi:hypothetical protein